MWTDRTDGSENQEVPQIKLDVLRYVTLGVRETPMTNENIVIRSFNILTSHTLFMVLGLEPNWWMVDTPELF